MRLLLDTHSLLWALGDPGRLGQAARDALIDGRNDVVLSSATVWEIAIKRALGKLSIEGSVVEAAEASGFRMLSIAADHADRAGALPRVHRDPFDRMLVAQALIEGLTMVTRDPIFARYGVPTLET